MRRNVYLPDDLAVAVSEQLPDLNVSELLQEALRAVLGCRHEALGCARCAAPIDRHAIADAATKAFYSALMWELGDLVRTGGTAEGAARIVKKIGLQHQVPGAASIPLPRPNRGAREPAPMTASIDRHPAGRPGPAGPQQPKQGQGERPQSPPRAGRSGQPRRKAA